MCATQVVGRVAEMKGGQSRAVAAVAECKQSSGGSTVALSRFAPAERVHRDDMRTVQVRGSGVDVVPV